MRKLLLAGAALPLVLLLSGCFPAILLNGPTTAGQQNVIGPIDVTGSVCTGELVPVSSCAPLNNGVPVTWQGQWLLSFRVPTDATGPASFVTSDTGSGTDSGQTLTFTRNESLEQALETTTPTDAATKWVAYATGFSSASDNEFTYAARFSLPIGTTFTYSTNPGFRQTTADHVGDPFNCALTTCTLPFPATDSTLSTRNLNVTLASTEQTVEQGATGDTSALFAFDGAADPAAKFDLSVDSTLPAGTFSLGTTSLEPATDADTTVPITITVPADTAPGDYPYTVRAAVAGSPSEVRQASAVLHVTEKPKPPLQEQQQPTTPQQEQQPVTPAGAPRLRVTTSVSPSRARPGKAVNLSLVVTNMGTAEAKGVRVCQKPFGRTTLVSTKPKAASSRSGQCFDVGNLAAGAKSKKLTVKVRVKRGAKAGKVSAAGTSTATGLPAVQHTAGLTVLKPAAKKKRR